MSRSSHPESCGGQIERLLAELTATGAAIDRELGLLAALAHPTLARPAGTAPRNLAPRLTNVPRRSATGARWADR